VGCYNYTTLKQPVPTHYYRELEPACDPAVGCSQCKPTFFKVGNELANTTNVAYLNLCMIMFGTQFFSWFDDPATITARLNCYYQFPPGMELGLSTPHRESRLELGVILGSCAVGALLVVTLLLVLLWVWLRVVRQVDASEMEVNACYSRLFILLYRDFCRFLRSAFTWSTHNTISLY
jgi:hypothetical protein